MKSATSAITDRGQLGNMIAGTQVAHNQNGSLEREPANEPPAMQRVIAEVPVATAHLIVDRLSLGLTVATVSAIHEITFAARNHQSS
jgi:hypothetical protein